jgi:hypothetical protein
MLRAIGSRGPDRAIQDYWCTTERLLTYATTSSVPNFSISYPNTNHLCAGRSTHWRKRINGSYHSYSHCSANKHPFCKSIGDTDFDSIPVADS